MKNLLWSSELSLCMSVLRCVLFHDTYNELMATLCATLMTFTTALFLLIHVTAARIIVLFPEALFIVLLLRKSSFGYEFRIYRTVRTTVYGIHFGNLDFCLFPF